MNLQKASRNWHKYAGINTKQAGRIGRRERNKEEVDMVTKDGTTQQMVTRSMDLSPCKQESKYQKHFVFLHFLTKKHKKKPKH